MGSVDRIFIENAKDEVAIMEGILSAVTLLGR